MNDLLKKELTFDDKFKLYGNYLTKENGLEKIFLPGLLNSLSEIKEINGKAIPETVDSLARAAINSYARSQQLEPFLNETSLSEYETLYQKSLFFKPKRIDTFEDFTLCYNALKKNKNIIFRGANESKYRLYSSLQRFWVSQKLEHKSISFVDFVKRTIHNALNDKRFNAFTNKKQKNHLAVLSTLQHYEAPTPLMDWTLSIDTALLFGLYGLNSKISQRRDIHNYFSLYYLEEDDFKYIDIKVHFKNTLDYIIKRAKNEGMLSGIASYGPVLTSSYANDIEKIFNDSVWYFSDYKGDQCFDLGLINNPNIKAQEGAFTINNNSTKPLEHVANMQEESEVNSDFANNVIISPTPICNSYEINKDLSFEISEFLASKGCFYKDLFPEPTNTEMVEICNEIFNKTKADFCI